MIKDFNNPLALALFICRAQMTDIRVDADSLFIHAAPTWASAAKALGLDDRGYVDLIVGSDGPVSVRPTKRAWSLYHRFAARFGLPAWARPPKDIPAWGA